MANVIMIFHNLLQKCTVGLLFSFIVKGFILPQFASSMRPSCTMKCAMRFRRKSMISMMKSDHLCSGTLSELLIYNGAAEEVAAALTLLSRKRPQLQIIHKPRAIGSNRSETLSTQDVITWSAHSGNLQLDCALLEPLFLGNTKLSNELTTQKWDEMLSQRLTAVKNVLSDDPKCKIKALKCYSLGLSTPFLKNCQHVVTHKSRFAQYLSHD